MGLQHAREIFVTAVGRVFREITPRTCSQLLCWCSALSWQCGLGWIFMLFVSHESFNKVSLLPDKKKPQKKPQKPNKKKTLHNKTKNPNQIKQAHNHYQKVYMRIHSNSGSVHWIWQLIATNTVRKLLTVCVYNIFLSSLYSQGVNNLEEKGIKCTKQLPLRLHFTEPNKILLI